MNRVKVAHITTVDISIRYLLLNQLRNLREAGYEAVGISSPGHEVTAIEAAGIRHIPVQMTRRAITPLADLFALWRLYKTIRHERFTIVHTHTPKANLLGQIAAFLAGAPIRISTVHGFYFTSQTPSLKRFVFRVIERVSASFPQVLFLINQEDVDSAHELRICAPKKLRLLNAGIGIDIERFNPSNLTEATLNRKRQNIGLLKNSRVVGFVGRLVAEKGILELLKAAQIVVEHIPTARFLFVGPFDYEKPDSLKPEIAREYGVADHCIFTGLRVDMPELYALMNVFVLPSCREGFPRAPMEASAMGVPCVVTDVRGCRDAVEHGRNGLLVPPGDVQALSDAIIELLTNREKAKAMGEEGRRMALERFDERLVFEKVKAEYARLLKEKGHRAPEPLNS